MPEDRPTGQSAPPGARFRKNTPASPTATRGAPDAPLYWLVSGFDGFTGWLVLTWTCLLAVLAWRYRNRFTAWAEGINPPA